MAYANRTPQIYLIPKTGINGRGLPYIGRTSNKLRRRKEHLNAGRICSTGKLITIEEAGCKDIELLEKVLIHEYYNYISNTSVVNKRNYEKCLNKLKGNVKLYLARIKIGEQVK